jgi:hypothetical protein
MRGGNGRKKKEKIEGEGGTGEIRIRKKRKRREKKVMRRLVWEMRPETGGESRRREKEQEER